MIHIFIIILMGILNWTLKLFVAWLMYLLAIWIQAPEWAMIAMVAIGAAETRVWYKATYR